MHVVCGRGLASSGSIAIFYTSGFVDDVIFHMAVVTHDAYF